MKKKSLLTILTLATSITVMAQTKPVEAKKSITDTMYHLKPVDVFNRAIIMQQAVQLVLRPDDFSVNQRKFIINTADSLIKVDAPWYNVVKPVKKPYARIDYENCDLEYSYTICPWSEVGTQIQSAESNFTDVDEIGFNEWKANDYLPEIKISLVMLTDKEFDKHFKTWG